MIDLEEEKSLVEKKSKLWVVWVMFGIFLIAFIRVIRFSSGDPNQIAWVLLGIWIIVIDVILLIKYKFPSAVHVGISCILAGLVFLSYFAIFFQTGSSALFLLIVEPILTFFSALASFRVFEVYPQKALAMIKKNSKKAVIVSILLGIAFGIAWGTINFFLMSGNAKPVFHLTIDCFLVSLSPAVLEEMAMRTLFYALCIAFLNGIVSTYFQKLTIWFMMIMPHVLVHTPETFRQDGFVAGLIVVVVYVILFGLIFAILQRKRDITSAMIAHGVVDFIRFCFFGLPF